MQSRSTRLRANVVESHLSQIRRNRIWDIFIGTTLDNGLMVINKLIW